MVFMVLYPADDAAATGFLAGSVLGFSVVLAVAAGFTGCCGVVAVAATPVAGAVGAFFGVTVCCITAGFGASGFAVALVFWAKRPAAATVRTAEKRNFFITRVK